MIRIRQRLACASYILSDAALGLCGRMGISLFSNGRRHVRYSTKESAEYAEWYVSLFEELLGGPGVFHGDVCEIGPGDSLAGGVLYRLRGADSVTFIERFQRQDDDMRERRVRELILDREAKRKNSALQSNFAKQSVHALADEFRLIRGDAEQCLLRDPRSYDFILSNSVFQHVGDPMRLLQLCYERLKPGGRMLHVIDLRNLGLLRKWGELAWLETPPEVHKLMVQNTGRPNRVRFKQYREWAESIEGAYAIRIRHLVGSKHPFGDILPEDVPEDAWSASCDVVREAQSRFTPTLRDHSASDHAVATFLLLVEKPHS